jgi:2,4-dienoyl-CoA reductase-like NADH-dependent reductase (Old Yellow Enzyme family)
MEANDAGPGGGVSERALERYKNLAHGKWGIVFVESLSVTGTFLARDKGLVINKQNLDGFKRLVDEFKKTDPDALLLFQVSHSGSHGGSFSKTAHVYPRNGEDDCFRTEELEMARDEFVAGVLLSQQAGADGIDYKLCHGYLGGEILRPANTRTDGWGGSFEDRTRFLREGIEASKSGMQPGSFLLGSRISMYEGVRGGCGTAGPDELIEDLSEMDKVLGLMADLGMHYVNVSAGLAGVSSELVRPVRSSKHLALHQFRYAKRAKEIGGSLRVIGSAYSVHETEAPAYAAENVRKGYTDFVGFGRQSFADPHYPKKLQLGESIDYCTLCSGCTRLMSRQANAGCVIYNDYYRDLLRKSEKDCR